MSKLKFLIIEDEMLIAMTMKMALERAGHRVCSVASSGDEAIAIAEAEKPDVLLMDIRLQGTMDGIEAARRIRASLPVDVIFTTGYAEPHIKNSAMSVNPLGFLIKPVTPRQIFVLLGIA